MFNKALAKRKEKESEFLNKMDVDPIACAYIMHKDPDWQNKIICPKNNTNFALDLSMDEFDGLAYLVTEQYTAIAQKIRDHFSTKLLMLQLSKKELTSYRTELLKFLSRKDYSYTANEIGMIRSLPRLWEEDTFLDELKENYNNNPWPEAGSEESQDITITLIGTHTKRSHRYTHQRYSTGKEFTCNWFHDEDDRLYLIETENMDPYRLIWAELIKFSIDIHGTRVKNHSRDDLYYYQLHDWYILNK